jgi:hypothetical protein
MAKTYKIRERTSIVLDGRLYAGDEVDELVAVLPKELLKSYVKRGSLIEVASKPAPKTNAPAAAKKKAARKKKKPNA